MDGNIGHPHTTRSPSPKAISVDTLIAAASSGRIKLPMVPKVVSTLIGQLQNPNVSVEDIAQELAHDPTLTARVMRMANSPFFCGYRQVSSISDAVVSLGTDSLRTLIISCGLTGAFVEVPGVDLPAFWAGSTLTAESAGALARLTALDRNAAYLSGLLHRIGHLILCMSHPDDSIAFTGVRFHGDTSLFESIEKNNFGLTHREIGAAWLDALGLPMMLVYAVRDYLDAPTETTGKTTILLRLADQLATSVASGLSCEDASSQLDQKCLQLLGLGSLAEDRRFESAYNALRCALNDR